MIKSPQVMKNQESNEPTIENKVKTGPHTSAELKRIREVFGPGADIALQSIYKRTGYKVTSDHEYNHTESVDK
jgi:hypothetical protein